MRFFKKNSNKIEKYCFFTETVRIIEEYYAGAVDKPTLILYLTPRKFWEMSEYVTVTCSLYNELMCCMKGELGYMWFRGAKLERKEMN